ncbi:threonine/serine dehydratase [uncultured Desulfosarcina sp.]|uniref:threonine ammonia-lyase n=1 Tax=uncultured Desulfosarcina sp. TaxID=218289 RepID=UPI0029C7D8BC|nr:threonine/serine dehydratase [uncultured Desulfosarcina sp.]
MRTCKEKISLAHALGAREIVRPHLTPTPLRQYPSLDRCVGTQVYIKHENHNPTGTFKIRGGITLMHHLTNDGVSGVITYSTGNHGASVAASAHMFGLTATVVVPEGSNPLKIQAIRDAGAELIEHGKDFEAAGRKVARLVEEKGLYFVHPANEPHLINGVGTEFLEIIEKVPDLDVMIVPLGAGSEAAAAITVLKQIRPEIEIIAVQAEASQAAFMSWKAGKIITAPNTTFAGGVATGTAYDIPFSLYKDALADFVLLTETELYEGIALAAHHTRNLTEGAGSACLRAAFKIRNRLSGKKVAIQMSGGNASGKELQKAMDFPCLLDGSC